MILPDPVDHALVDPFDDQPVSGEFRAWMPPHRASPERLPDEEPGDPDSRVGAVDDDRRSAD
jgi:hypothetical protein